MEESKKYITTEELRKHNKRDDVWISINGKVYDVTNWLQKHPGGEELIMNLAGQDVTDAFIAFHPGTAWKYLDGFFTGFHLQDFRVSDVSKDYRRLASEFAKAGMFDKKGHFVFFSFLSIAVMFSMCIYGVIFSKDFWVHLLSGAVLGFAWVQVTFLGHDSGHYQIMSTRRFNKFAQILTGNCLTGISIAWWKWTHNAHHVAVNSLEHDPDLQHLPVFAVSSSFFNTLTSKFYGRKLDFDSLARFFVSYQHLTFYPIMIVARVNLYLQTILLLLNPSRKVPDRALNIIGILIYWTWFPLLVSFLPNWNERILFVLASFTVTAFQHIQFCLNHFAANVYVGNPQANDWFQSQTAGTIDITCSTWMDWVYGGLQFQLEHHLFPRMPRCHLRSISPVVQDLCKKHNLPYRSYGFYQANKKTIGVLRKAALQARDLSIVPQNLLWEAVNTHG
ncbi:OLC1v1000242C1 [Oldenlandia corymbosa var. corymbosa]|uniref:OLC1v1000242C1 n=1 Tax=Oldenlandia corymbosa var. corymbosa TaxID=529605 RepID=A0AAV1D2G8_OLDCO|nr:OLC1v1000242C1 [Oldenlandia corymbosa var. corymbosa]